MVDAAYDVKGALGAELSIKEDGLYVKIDAQVHPRCTGEIEMHFKAQFSQAELDQFPSRQLSFNFAPELVPKIFGVPG
jgi:hypothetical protein